MPGEQRKSCSHAGGRKKNQQKGQRRIQTHFQQTAGRGELRLSATNDNSNRIGSVQSEWDEQRSASDAQLKQSVSQNRTLDAMLPPSRDPRSQCQTAHIRSKNRSQSRLRGPENGRKLPQPDGLVKQARKARQEKTNANARQKLSSRRRLIRAGIRQTLSIHASACLYLKSL